MSEQVEFVCDFCTRLATAMVGESNEILVCVEHLAERETS